MLLCPVNPAAIYKSSIGTLPSKPGKTGPPIFLAAGFDCRKIGDAVRQVHPYAVDVSSGVESAPGKKDHTKIRAFVKAAKG